MIFHVYSLAEAKTCANCTRATTVGFRLDGDRTVPVCRRCMREMLTIIQDFLIGR